MKRPLCLVVIGGTAAGPKAASSARRINPDMDITIVTEEPFVSYGGCGLAYYIGGIVKERSRLFARSPSEFRDKHSIAVFLGHRATRIDSVGRTVRVDDIASGVSRTMEYDRLLIATGASPVLPPIGGIDAPGVFSLRTVTDAEAIREYIASRRVEDAVIIGGGYLGTEVAENLIGRGIRCTIVEREQHLLPRLFDPDMARLVLEEVVKQGVMVLTGIGIDRIVTGNEGAVSAVVAGGEEHVCQMVVAATGVRPNVSLAREARIALGPTGAIRVDARMETSVRGIFAAGDCVETINLVSGRPGWYPLGSTANRQGRVAGANIAGKDKTFPGVVGTAITKVFDVAAGCTGLGDSEARESGLEPVSAVLTAPTQAGYYPGGGTVTLKLLADAETKRLLGAQAVGTRSVDKIIDTIAATLTGKLTPNDLTNLDLAYAPPYSTPLGAITIAAGMLAKKLERE